MPISLATPFLISVKKNISGESSVIATLSGSAINSEKLSEFSLARLFGIISPKMSTRTVITAVAIPTEPEPSFSVNITVASADEAIFTTLLPISMQVSALSKSSVIFKARCALLFPSAA